MTKIALLSFLLAAPRGPTLLILTLDNDVIVSAGQHSSLRTLQPSEIAIPYTDKVYGMQPDCDGCGGVPMKRYHRESGKIFWRDEADLLPEVEAKKRKHRLPLLLQSRRAWREAESLRSADPTAITTDEVEELYQEFIDLRGQLGAGP